MAGALRVGPPSAARYVVDHTVLSSRSLGGARTLFATVAAPEYRKDEVLAPMHLLATGAGVVVNRALAGPRAPAAARCSRPSGPAASLRVGYLPDSLPFAFVNERGDLVGFDVELAHRLARELGVTARLCRYARRAWRRGSPMAAAIS